MVDSPFVTNKVDFMLIMGYNIDKYFISKGDVCYDL